MTERPHRYLSTSCLHGEHEYCQSNTGHAGSKKPAECKFCNAPCICPCHTRQLTPQGDLLTQCQAPASVSEEEERKIVISPQGEQSAST